MGKINHTDFVKGIHLWIKDAIDINDPFVQKHSAVIQKLCREKKYEEHHGENCPMDETPFALKAYRRCAIIPSSAWPSISSGRSRGPRGLNERKIPAAKKNGRFSHINCSKFILGSYF